MTRSGITTVVLLLVLAVLSIAFTGCSQGADKNTTGEVIPGIPVKNTVTMVDLGAKTCVPCKLMVPILEEVTTEYTGRAEIVFIDVRDAAHEGKALQLGVSMIPTQIFYDKNGNEVYRHAGFMDKDAIVAKLEEILSS